MTFHRQRTYSRPRKKILFLTLFGVYWGKAGEVSHCIHTVCHGRGRKIPSLEIQDLFRKVREVLRVKHYSIRTEESYLRWIQYFLRFHHNQNPIRMGKMETSNFLTHLAVQKRVAASTQNQALSALLFLYKEVLQQPLDWLENVQRAKRPERIPIVFSRGEVKTILQQMKGTKWIMANLLYGSGLRLMECLRLRVKGLDFEFQQIVIRDDELDEVWSLKRNRITLVIWPVLL